MEWNEVHSPSARVTFAALCLLFVHSPYLTSCTLLLPSQIAMAIVAQKNTHRVLDAFMVITLYPLSLALVAGLEAIGWD